MKWVFLGSCRYRGPAHEVAIPNQSLATIAAMVVLSPRGRIERGPAIESLWRDEDWRLKRKRFNTAVWRLRAMIRQGGGVPEDELATLGGGLVRRTHDTSDSDAGALTSAAALAARRQDRNLTPADEARMSTALRLYQGDFLPGATDHWSLVTREALRTSLIILLDILARHHRRHRNWPRVNALAHRILAVDPALEEAHRMLIESHIAMKDPASARRQFELCARMLRDTLDAEPSEETKALLAEGGGVRKTESLEARRIVPPQKVAIDQALSHLSKATRCLNDLASLR